MVDGSRPVGVSTGQCVRPTLELWNDRLRQIFAAVPPLNCSMVEQNWVNVDNGSLHINKSVFQRHGSIDCQYTPVKRGRDDFEVMSLRTNYLSTKQQ